MALARGSNVVNSKDTFIVGAGEGPLQRQRPKSLLSGGYVIFQTSFYLIALFGLELGQNSLGNDMTVTNNIIDGWLLTLTFLVSLVIQASAFFIAYTL